MNAVVVGAPLGAAGALARALAAAEPGAPVTLVSGDGPALLAALDEPGLGEVLLVDHSVPATCDQALVHRQLLHGAPEVLVVGVEGTDDGWALGELVAQRFPQVPLLVTGPGAMAAADCVAALAAAREAEGLPPLTDVLPGVDPGEVQHRLRALSAAGARAALSRAARAAPSCCH